MALSKGKIDTEYAPEILIVSHLVLPDIILRWPTTEAAFHRYDDKVGVCLCPPASSMRSQKLPTNILSTWPGLCSKSRTPQGKSHS